MPSFPHEPSHGLSATLEVMSDDALREHLFRHSSFDLDRISQMTRSELIAEILVPEVLQQSKAPSVTAALFGELPLPVENELRALMRMERILLGSNLPATQRAFVWGVVSTAKWLLGISGRPEFSQPPPLDVFEVKWGNQSQGLFLNESDAEAFIADHPKNNITSRFKFRIVERNVIGYR